MVAMCGSVSRISNAVCMYLRTYIYIYGHIYVYGHTYVSNGGPDPYYVFTYTYMAIYI